jgi:hypothetical protein
MSVKSPRLQAEPGSRDDLHRASRRADLPSLAPAEMRSLGPAVRPLEPSARDFFEARLNRDFDQVRVHSGRSADDLTRSLSAKALTVGEHIFVRQGEDTALGQRSPLLAHELTHVAQNRGSAPGPITALSSPADAQEVEAESLSGLLVSGSDRAKTPEVIGRTHPHVAYRLPAPPEYKGSVGKLDRSVIALDDVADFLLTVVGGKPSFAAQTVNPHVIDASITHMSWMLYDPSDNELPGSYSTLPTNPAAITSPFAIAPDSFEATSPEGRYLLRCVGRNAAHEPVAYSDRSFFVWKTKPISFMNLPELKAITSAPAKHSIGEVGAASARSMLLEHQQAVAATGTGKFMGNRAGGPVPAGVTSSDCTEYILSVLRTSFEAKGRGGDWKAVYDAAVTGSGAGGFKGMALVQSLESSAGWKGVFWGKDPRDPSDRLPEHPVAYKKVRETGSYYGAAVDTTRSAVEYTPTSPRKPESMANLDRLRHVPLGLVATKGAVHMGLLLNGQLYELHWEKTATDPDVIQATPLEKWEWQTGVVVAPADDLDAAWAK